METILAVRVGGVVLKGVIGRTVENPYAVSVIFIRDCFRYVVVVAVTQHYPSFGAAVCGYV